MGTPSQMYQLIGRELGELRALLSPEQQEVFDSNVRTWKTSPQGTTFVLDILGGP